MEESCSRCQAVKPRDQFPTRRGSGKITRPRMCSECRNRADREKSLRWAERNPEAARLRYKVYEQRHNDVRRARWHEDPAYREQNKLAAKRWRGRNSDKYLPKLRRRHQEMRQAVIEMYGGSCACCNESTWEFLSIDHVNGGGSQARKAGESVAALRRKLLSHGSPHPDYQLLCHNCNAALGHYGYCPHQVNTAQEKLGA